MYISEISQVNIDKGFPGLKDKKKLMNECMPFPGYFVFSSFFWANTCVAWMSLQLCY